MLNHLTLRVTSAQKSKVFYQKVLAPLGYQLFSDKPTAVGFGQKDVEGTRDFWMKDGEVSEVKSFSCPAFTAASKEQVDEFHKAALLAGGIDNGAPGYRPEYHAGYYAAFILDPDGYNIEAVWDDLEKLKAVGGVAPHEL